MKDFKIELISLESEKTFVEFKINSDLLEFLKKEGNNRKPFFQIENKTYISEYKKSEFYFIAREKSLQILFRVFNIDNLETTFRSKKIPYENLC